MKIGIVTIFNVLNYGAVLQGLALYKAIEDMGHEAYMINYIPKRLKRKTKQVLYDKEVSLCANAKNFVKRTILGIGRGKTKAFRRFLHNNERATATCETINDSFINGKFNYIVVGSDQVWNPEYTEGNIDENFTLRHVTATRKISFSSSLGSCVLSDDNKSFLKNSLASFDAVSVREEYAKKLLTEIGIERVERTCDPTFLLEQSQWHKLINKADKGLCPPKKYLLIYTFDHDKRCFEVAQNIAQRLDLRIVSISSCIPKPRCVMKQFSSLSPSGFLALFEQSSFVVTNSFHGTCFSLIFEKDFISVNKTNNPVRIQDLLSDFGLLSRLYKAPEDLKKLELPINYALANKKKAAIRQKAITYLQKSLC